MSLKRSPPGILEVLGPHSEIFSPVAVDQTVVDCAVYLDGDRWDQTTVWFGIPDTNGSIPQPVQKAVFTSFSHGAVLQSPVTIKWTPCTDPAANQVWVGLESDVLEENYIFPVDVTEFDEPLYLNAGHYEIDLSYEVWYETRTPDGIEILCGKESESDYEFTIAP